jgi:simple sugar transport system ATP-binding protein
MSASMTSSSTTPSASAAAAGTESVLELRQATKKYAGVPAIDGVDFSLRPGEIHSIIGENGAGKSTLTKVMAGVVQLSSGQMLVAGQPVSPRTPHEALALGVAMVFQETSLVPTMTVAQNLFLGQEKYFNRLRGIYIAAQQFLQSLQFDVDPTAVVSLLGAAKKQMVEIARAVLHNARVIIFDEPTASLTPEEKKYFFDLVFNLKARGVAVIFISHALEEALLVSDRITILRDGKHVVTDDKANFDRARIVQAMVGRDLSQTLYGQRKTAVRPQGRRVLSVQNLRMASMVKNNSLSVFAGQVTGVFGLVGSGRTETFKVVAGVIKRDFMHGGEVLLNGRPVRYFVPASAVRDGIAYVTEDRKIEGFFETQSIAGNIYLGLLAKLRGKRTLVSAKEAGEVGTQWIQKLNIRAISKDVKAIELSGGNQQKVVIAKSLIQEPELIIFDEPTRGVDVGAIAEIHALINQLADEGKAVVVISSYLPEIMSLSDRILVQRMGKVVEEYSALEATEEKIMYAAIH